MTQTNENEQTQLQHIKSQVVAIDDESTADQVAEAITQVDFFMSQARELRRSLDDALLKWLSHPDHRELIIGDIRYYAGTEKKIKCVDPMATLESLLDATDGDINRVVECLASGAWKYGACRNLLSEEQYKSCFSEELVSDLKTGKPVKQVKKIDSRFIKPLS